MISIGENILLNSRIYLKLIYQAAMELLPICFLIFLKKTIDKFHSALKERRGHLILSGILKYDKDYLIGKYCQNYFEHIETLEEDEWVAIHIKGKII
jgi:hypothetical protein